jgi:hypothetical protein
MKDDLPAIVTLSSEASGTTVFDDSTLRGLLGEIKKTPYDDGIWQCVEAGQPST